MRKTEMTGGIVKGGSGRSSGEGQQRMKRGKEVTSWENGKKRGRR